jgi:hypothetical protein
MPASTLKLTDFETRLNTALSDSGSILWTLAEKDEALKTALGDISTAAGVKLTIDDLDSAAATTLDALDESLLIKGAAGYAARTRALERAQRANISETMPDSLLEWAKNQSYYYEQKLPLVKARYLAQSTASPHSPVIWDESNKNW